MTLKLSIAAGATAMTLLVPAASVNAQSYYYPQKIKPSLSLKVKPKRDKKKPYKFTASGKLNRKGAAKSACKGKVTITFKKGKKTVKSGKATVKSSCKYSKKFTVKKRGKLKVSAKFGGNTLLKTATAKSKTVRAG
jgi:hypothetical protein